MSYTHSFYVIFFFFNNTATTVFYTLSLHDALPIYELAPSAVKAEIDKHKLTMLNINSPQGPAGEPGLAAVAGREQDFSALFAKRSEEHTSELQSRRDLVCRLLLEKKKKNK